MLAPRQAIRVFHLAYDLGQFFVMRKGLELTCAKARGGRVDSERNKLLAIDADDRSNHSDMKYPARRGDRLTDHRGMVPDDECADLMTLSTEVTVAIVKRHRHG